jgi:hypothetical protein
MSDASREDIEQFFADAGWSYHRLEGDDWETRYSGSYTNQVITVRMTQYWVYFYATLINRVDEANRTKMYEHLALLNYKVSFGKFSVDKSNRICLGVEVPRENLQPSVFKDALNALSYLIDEHFRELLNLATDPEYVSKLKLEQEGQTASTSTPTTAATIIDSADEDVDWGDDAGVEVTDAPTAEGSGDTASASGESASSSADGDPAAGLPHPDTDSGGGPIIPLPPPHVSPPDLPPPPPPLVASAPQDTTAGGEDSATASGDGEASAAASD